MLSQGNPAFGIVIINNSYLHLSNEILCSFDKHLLNFAERKLTLPVFSPPQEAWESQYSHHNGKPFFDHFIESLKRKPIHLALYITPSSHSTDHEAFYHVMKEVKPHFRRAYDDLSLKYSDGTVIHAFNSTETRLEAAKDVLSWIPHVPQLEEALSIPLEIIEVQR